MRNRAGQALNAAMDLKLHCRGNEGGFYAEANRRVWWQTYIVACQGAILSNSAPPMLLYDPRFTTAHPTFGMDTGVRSIAYLNFILTDFDSLGRYFCKHNKSLRMQHNL